MAKSRPSDFERLALTTADAVITTHDRLVRQAQRIDKVVDVPGERIRAAEIASRFESWAARKASPRLRRSDKIAAFDQRVAELEARQQLVLEEINALNQAIPRAEGEHQAELTAWHREPKGARPDSPVPELEARLHSLKEDHATLATLIDEALADKAAWVEEHREALVRDARAAKDEARATYSDAVELLVKARDGLLTARRDELWAELYPDPSARSEPPVSMVAGGIVSRLRTAVPGLAVTFGVPELCRLLEADADFAASAIAPDQKRVLTAREPVMSATSAAIWTATDEGREALRRDHQKARERYFNEWGTWPGW